MGIPYIDFVAIKLLVPIQLALLELGSACGARCPDGERWGCPLHHSRGGRRSSFRVRGLEWFCHKCQRGGDVVRLWGLVHGMDDYTAAVDLCRALSVGLPLRATRRKSPPEQR